MIIEKKVKETNMVANGLTMYICFGKYAGFHIGNGKLLLGWVSIAVTLCDIEVTIQNLVEEIKTKD